MLDKTQKFAELKIDEKSIKVPVSKGTLGPDVLDIRSLYKETGLFTYDPGFTSTASCDSNITFIDGDKGELLYRGYPIEELAEKSNFLEVAYLLLRGELPTKPQYDDFCSRVTRHTMLHEQMLNFFRGFRRDAHPMAIVCGVQAAMSAFYHDSTDINDPWQREVATIRMIAKLPTIVAWAYKYSIGQPFAYPKNNLQYAPNFLQMCFSVPAEDYVSDPVLSKAMDRIFILHADHEQNASTSTVRLAASSGANPFACIAAGIACLWGPAHGGANEAALNMLKEIGTPNRIPEYILKAKDKTLDDEKAENQAKEYIEKKRKERAEAVKAMGSKQYDTLNLFTEQEITIDQIIQTFEQEIKEEKEKAKAAKATVEDEISQLQIEKEAEEANLHNVLLRIGAARLTKENLKP